MELHRAVDEEESYFVSMTDMMVGVLFIFIILLMYFAMQLRDRTEEIEKIDKSANDERTEMLLELEDDLLKVGVTVKIDPENGILRLPEKILFASGQPDLSEGGKVAVGKLAFALDKALQCRALNAQLDQTFCKESNHKVETIFIEGHTDGDQIRGAPFGNWKLSSDRATNTFSELMESEKALSVLKNSAEQPIFSVSGYADTRPVAVEMRGAQPQNLKEAKSANRRIDLRIIMERRDPTEQKDRAAETKAE